MEGCNCSSVLLYKLVALWQVLHYAQELFEGMKAYRGVDGKIRLFRPMHNMARMNLTATRACLPNFDGFQLLECIRR
jgi:branched-chain amino acid aminotransferase